MVVLDSFLILPNYPWVVDVFSNRDLSSNSVTTNDNSLFCFGIHLSYVDQQLEQKFLMPGAGVYVKYSLLLLWGTLPTQAS